MLKHKKSLTGIELPTLGVLRRQRALRKRRALFAQDDKALKEPEVVQGSENVQANPRLRKAIAIRR